MIKILSLTPYFSSPLPQPMRDRRSRAMGCDLQDDTSISWNLPDTINHRWTKALLASPDGRKMYVGVGSNSNVGENGLAVEYRRAAVLEVGTATGASRIYASGLRNPTGLGWEPTSGKLWAIISERDEIGADLVPDYMTAVQELSQDRSAPRIFLTGMQSRSTPSRQRTLMAHPVKGTMPCANSSAVGALGTLKGRMPQRGQK